MVAKAESARICRLVNTLVLVLLAIHWFIVPGLLVVYYASDPQMTDRGIPRIAWRLHKDLTPRLENWARARVASGKADFDELLDLYNVPLTEWPMFSCVFYLWSTDALQSAWDEDKSLSRREPRVYARDSIEAAVDLIMDPVHHSWVKLHWGDDYMHQENVFFRSLIISGLTSYEKLVGDGKYLAVLRDQVDTLAAELDASPHGVLEDYPAECYPIDVFAAIACIKRADEVLGTDHSGFIDRSVRAFEGRMLDKRGLIPYLVEADTGRLMGPSRGVGNSYILIFAPELWPDRARRWYELYAKHFWQERWWAAGFREYPRELEPELASYVDERIYYDVDAGPIIDGFSPAANAFGLAAARVNGRFDHAKTLASQIIAAAWPLPGGGLLGPRFLSSREHAPCLGEACLLFDFTRTPNSSMDIVADGGHWPGCVYLALLFYFGVGVLLVIVSLRGYSKRMREEPGTRVPVPRLQFSLWMILIVVGCFILAAGSPGYGMIAILSALLLPREKKVG